VTISERDRQRWAAQVASLKEAETDEEPSPEVRALRIAAANERRAAKGIPPLKEELDIDPPELEFYRLARARGFRRIRS
jgi:hypothetical protein